MASWRSKVINLALVPSKYSGGESLISSGSEGMDFGEFMAGGDVSGQEWVVLGVEVVGLVESGLVGTKLASQVSMPARGWVFGSVARVLDSGRAQLRSSITFLPLKTS